MVSNEHFLNLKRRGYTCVNSLELQHTGEGGEGGEGGERGERGEEGEG